MAGWVLRLQGVCLEFDGCFLVDQAAVCVAAGVCSLVWVCMYVPPVHSFLGALLILPR
jgi:hypothetical protein